MTVRQALIAKHESKYHYADQALQTACALGRTAKGAPGPSWDKCPGNRRYIQYMYDAMILQANGAPSMVDMKNAELAAVMMRDKADYDTVAEAFASRGLGAGSSSKTGEDTDPTPSFAAPKAADNATVTFSLVDATTGVPVKGSVYVGMYRRRCVPIATTLGGDERSAQGGVHQGTYALTVQADGYGIQRFTRDLRAGRPHGSSSSARQPRVQELRPVDHRQRRRAAPGQRVRRHRGDQRRLRRSAGGRSRDHREVPAAKQTFNRIAVSALHHPAKNLPEGGTEIEGRFLGIRAFDLQASTDGGKTFKTIYPSPSNFFPSERPRPVAPDLINREIRFPSAITADAVKLVIRSSACTGTPEFNQEEEADPAQDSACTSLAGYSTQVTVTELEVFEGRGSAVIRPVAAPPVAAPPAAPGPVAGPTHLAATGASTTLGLGAMLLLGMAGVVAPTAADVLTPSGGADHRPLAVTGAARVAHREARGVSMASSSSSSWWTNQRCSCLPAARLRRTAPAPSPRRRRARSTTPGDRQAVAARATRRVLPARPCEARAAAPRSSRRRPANRHAAVADGCRRERPAARPGRRAPACRSRGPRHPYARVRPMRPPQPSATAPTGEPRRRGDGAFVVRS